MRAGTPPIAKTQPVTGNTLYDTWLLNATPWEIRRYFKLVGISRAYSTYLRQGQRIPGIATATEIVKTCNTLRSQAPDGVVRLPEMTRADLIPQCRMCPYFRKCVEAEALEQMGSTAEEMQNAGIRTKGVPEGHVAVTLARIPQPETALSLITRLERERDSMPEDEREYVTSGWDDNNEEDE